MRVNVIGHALTCREAIRQMVKQGTGGAIVNVSSEAASCGEDTRPAYAASKAGVNALMRQIALRWGKEGIRCNCVAPGIPMSATDRKGVVSGKRVPVRVDPGGRRD